MAAHRVFYSVSCCARVRLRLFNHRLQQRPHLLRCIHPFLQHLLEKRRITAKSALTITASFNGRLREECLNQHWFVSMEEAGSLIEAWRQAYNEERPHY